MKAMNISALALLVVLAPTTATAAAKWTFSDVDTDGNLELTQREFGQAGRDAFASWDRDRNERLSRSELYGGLFATWDKDNDGRLGDTEYREGYTAWIGGDVEPRFEAIAGEDAFIEERELEAGLGDRLGDLEPGAEGLDWGRFHVALFDVYDQNDDGVIGEREYAPFGRTEVTGLGERQGAAALAAPEAAGTAQPIQAGEVIAMADWDAEELYVGGMSVDSMIDDMEVYGPTGDEIGSIENVVFSRDGRILSVIAEVGGFLDMFDTHVNIPWDEVSYTDGRINIPVTEENVEDYSVDKADYLTAQEAAAGTQVVDDDLTTGPRAFRATDLIGDYARIRTGDTAANAVAGTDTQRGYANYGYVNDLIIRDGRLAAVVVEPESRYGMTGRLAYPYYGGGWRAGAPYYDMPYGETDVVEADRVDYSRFENQ